MGFWGCISVELSVSIQIMDLHEFIANFHDFLAPKLDSYEQAIYLYVFRHSKLRPDDGAFGGTALSYVFGPHVD